MKDDLVDDVQRELEAALDVAPSPQFVARVRVAVENGRATNWRWSRWIGIGAVSVAALLLVLLPGVWSIARSSNLWYPMNRISPNFRPSGPRRRRPAALEVAAAQVAVAPLAANNPSTAPVAEAPKARPAVEPVFSVTETRQPEPEVLVPPDQRIALAQLMARLKDGRLDATSLPLNVFEDVSPALDAPANDSDDESSLDIVRRLSS